MKRNQKGQFIKGHRPYNKGTAKNVYCINCGKQLKNHKAIRCQACATKFRWKYKEYKEKVSKKISSGKKGIKFTEEHKRNISKSKLGHIPYNKGKHIQTNTGRTHFKKGSKINLGRKRPDMLGKNNHNYGKVFKPFWGKYQNINMRSGWEIGYAKYLNKNNIKWEYEPKTFDLGNTTYTPDFYLPESNGYIEIKGYLTEEAKQKIEKFLDIYKQINFKLLKSKELKKIGVIT